MNKINYFKVIPDVTAHYMALEAYFKTTKISARLREMIKIRASALNGCAYCLNMHIIDARKLDGDLRFIDLIPVYHETDYFTEEEKAVLELTDTLTKVSKRRISPELRLTLAKYFTTKDFSDLVVIISQINTWNRLNIAAGNDFDPNYK